ncbi:MAG: rane protein [Betaproteobacteria bacterium]|nr:rane protein [Betaproteobacteria bacterium]
MNATLKSALVVLGGMTIMMPASTLAQVNGKNQGYLVDQDFKVVTAVGGTVCVRTSDWTPARAAAAEAGAFCDRDLVPKKPGPVAAAPAPAPAPAAKPPAAAKPAPEKMLPQKINFSADALFDFDKADLKAQGKAMLDDLSRVIEGANYEVILAIGHADRIGSAKYNQKLSLRRAESVKKYLVDKGIAPNRIYADSKGETQPRTKPGDCKMKNRKALIACLQPDRRVDVEVSGTK